MKKQKRKYVAPILKKNKPLVNISFASGGVTTTATTTTTGPVVINGGAPASGAPS